MSGRGKCQKGADFERRLAKIKNAPILALDDLGAEAGQNVPFEVSWAQDKAYQLLDHRLVEQLPTIVTTNLPSCRNASRHGFKTGTPRV
jgi:DNA replication protein DnaC